MLAGEPAAEHDRQLYPINLNAVTLDGQEPQLELYWQFDPAVVSQGKAGELTDAFEKSLWLLVEDMPNARRSPGDFKLAGVTQAELDSLLANDPSPEKIWRATAMQEGLVRHLGEDDPYICLLYTSDAADE